MTKGIEISIDGVKFTGWKQAEVGLDMKDFSAEFNFICRDQAANTTTLAAALGPFNERLKEQQEVTISVAGFPVLKGSIEKRATQCQDGIAEITISGRCQAGDLVDCAALVEPPAEYRNVKLETAVEKIVAPFGLKVRTEVDTGEPFERYGLDLAETAHSAIEKGARQRQCIVMSDGIGNVVLTRAGAKKASGKITFPGTAVAVSGEFSTVGRFSKTVVHGQHEKAGKTREGDAALDKTAEALAPGDRQDGDGSATKAERKGTAGKGVATDDEIRRYRPKVYLARTKADHGSADEEAKWRSKTARAGGEALTYTMRGHTVDGDLWKINTLVPVEDAFNNIDRDMLIAKVKFREAEDGRFTDLDVTSPEAFAAATAGKKSRKNKSGGQLDTTAEAL